jgi:electron transfer flavoprotein alpha subunit
MAILVVIEHEKEKVKPAGLSTLRAAMQLDGKVTALVVGYSCQLVVQQVQGLQGVDEVVVYDNEYFHNISAELLAAIILRQVEGVSHILAPATTFGKNVLPRVAAQLDVGQVSDVVEIVNNDTFCRPIYAGNAIVTVRVCDPVKVMTIRSTAFLPVESTDDQVAARKVNSAVSVDSSAKFVSMEQQGGERPELSSADIVVSGGRGLQNSENFDELTTLADRLGAAVGASRAAVDSGLAPNDLQVGQTGQVVAPKLYFAVGISGAIQHLAGMKDSQVIVAINKDPDAPIFQVADYGLVADIMSILPEWNQVLTKMGYS